MKKILKFRYYEDETIRIDLGEDQISYTNKVGGNDKDKIEYAMSVLGYIKKSIEESGVAPEVPKDQPSMNWRGKK